MWSGDLNSGLHSCAASTLASEVASQPSSYPSEQSHQTPFFFPVEDENYTLLPREFSGKACVKWQARCWRTNTSLAFPAIFYQWPGPKLYRVLTEKPYCREFLVGMTWISVLKRRKKKKAHRSQAWTMVHVKCSEGGPCPFHLSAHTPGTQSLAFAQASQRGWGGLTLSKCALGYQYLCKRF